MREFNPLNVEDLVKDIFDRDHGGSIRQFQNDFAEPVLVICELIKKCYAGFLLFENHKEPDKQFAFLTAHVYALVESLYTSTKLLAHGFLAPSGNQFRVSIEAVALSVLLSYRQKILIREKKHSVLRNFFEGFLSQEQWAKAHLAIKIAEDNRERLGLSAQALNLLKQSKKLYNSYSHVSLLSIRSTIISSDRVLFGGGYEHEQKPLFEEQLKIRRIYLEKIPAFIELLYKKSV